MSNIWYQGKRGCQPKNAVECHGRRGQNSRFGKMVVTNDLNKKRFLRVMGEKLLCCKLKKPAWQKTGLTCAKKQNHLSSFAMKGNRGMGSA